MKTLDKFMREYPGAALLIGFVLGFAFAALLFAKSTGSTA